MQPKPEKMEPQLSILRLIPMSCTTEVVNMIHTFLIVVLLASISPKSNSTVPIDIIIDLYEACRNRKPGLYPTINHIKQTLRQLGLYDNILLRDVIYHIHKNCINNKLSSHDIFYLERHNVLFKK